MCNGLPPQSVKPLMPRTNNNKRMQLALEGSITLQQHSNFICCSYYFNKKILKPFSLLQKLLNILVT